MTTRWQVFTRDEEHMMDIPIQAFATLAECGEFAETHNGPEYLQAACGLERVEIPRWEVARINGYGSKADFVIGPFMDRTKAFVAMSNHNDLTHPLAGSVWVWAEWGVVPRAPKCEVRRVS